MSLILTRAGQVTCAFACLFVCVCWYCTTSALNGLKQYWQCGERQNQCFPDIIWFLQTVCSKSIVERKYLTWTIDRLCYSNWKSDIFVRVRLEEKRDHIQPLACSRLCVQMGNLFTVVRQDSFMLTVRVWTSRLCVCVYVYMRACVRVRVGYKDQTFASIIHWGLSSFNNISQAEIVQNLVSLRNFDHRSSRSL